MAQSNSSLNCTIVPRFNALIGSEVTVFYENEQGPISLFFQASLLEEQILLIESFLGALQSLNLISRYTAYDLSGNTDSHHILVVR